MKSYFDLVQEIKGQPRGLNTIDLRENQSELDKRMQTDSDLLHLSKYTLKDAQGKAVPGIINVTLNIPAIFAANVFSALGTTKQQVVVESNDKAVDTHFIEAFLDSAFQVADRRLWERSWPTLGPFADIQLCMRGRTARRVLMYEKEGQVVVDIKPWDGRYVYRENGENGLKWAAYECIRTRDELIAEYTQKAQGTLEAALSKIRSGEHSVLDAWDEEHNEIWINGAKVWEEEHSFGFCPVVEQIVTLGYGAMLLDRGWEKYNGESIFFMIRDIIPELNRLVSILQTLNMNQIKAALQYQNPEGSPQDEPPDRPELGDVVSVGKGSLSPINLGEARAAAQMVYNIMEKARQEGSFTDIDIGNVQQPFSAVALMTIGESRDMVYMPRLAAKEMLNKATAEMLIRQAEQIGGTIELGIPGHKQSYAVSKLQGSYEVNYRYFTKSPKLDIARMSLAESAARWYPREYIYTEILHVEDPDGMLADWYAEQAESLSPGVKIDRIIRALLRKAKKNNDVVASRQAQIMAIELGLAIDQMNQGFMPEQAQEPDNGRQQIPLLPPRGTVGGTRSPVGNQTEEQTNEEIAVHT